MGNMSLFEKIMSNQDEISLIDLFGGIKEKHSKLDMENTLLAGTAIDTAANESTMLQKWRIPWLFMQVLMIGLAFTAVLIICAIFVPIGAVNILCILFGSCVVPVALMVFFWEMNVPRNISIFQLAACFVTGGLFSIVISVVLGDLMDIWAYAFLAPVAEEPGKLIISLLILKWVSKKKDFKIYGMTGLTIGAAVGAGFAAFETAQYAFSGGLATLLMRTLVAFSSHVMYCAPYVAVAALLMKNNTFDLEFLQNKQFWKVFLFSCGIHAFWNFTAAYLPYFIFIWVVLAVEIYLVWAMTIRIIRQCFRQIARNVSIVTGASVLATDLRLRCIQGVHMGKVFALKQSSILIGTDSSCNLVYPFGTLGISDFQCKMVVQNGALYLADVGSRDGTYLNGMKLKPLKGQLLKRGDIFWLGSENEKYRVE